MVAGAWQHQKTGSGTNVGTLPLNRTQSRVVTVLTGHNTLRRHLYILGLSNSPLYRIYVAEDETLVHIICECAALVSLSHMYLGSFFLESEDIKNIILGTIRNFGKVTVLP
jgi:hypothetical protein